MSANRLNLSKIHFMQITLILHNLIRWAVLLSGVWAVFNGLTGFITKRNFSKSDNLSGLLFMIFCDIQLLIGISLFVSNAWFDKVKAGMGDVMKNNIDRFVIIEHGLIMIIAWVLVHVGKSAIKKSDDKTKHKKMLVFFGIALLLILVSIPWPFRTEVARPLFRWFN